MNHEGSKDSAFAVMSNDNDIPDVATEMTVAEDAHRDPESEDTHLSRHRLMRTATREEITQTDSNPSCVQEPLEKPRRPWTQHRRIIFILGCAIGVILAWAFRSPDLQLEGLLDSVDMPDFFDDIKAVLPSALPIGLVREATEIQEHSRKSALNGAFSIGDYMSKEGMTGHYPVVMVRPFRLRTKNKVLIE